MNQTKLRNLFPHTTDFLTLRLTKKVIGLNRNIGSRIFATEFVGFKPKIRRHIIEHELKNRRYNSLLVTPLFEGGSHVPNDHPRFDLLDKPLAFYNKLKNYASSNIKFMCLLHLEDAPNAMDKYGPLDNFAKVCVNFVERIEELDPNLISAWIWGVEASEWISKLSGYPKDSWQAFEELAELGNKIALISDTPQIIHLNTGLWGPVNKELEWWNKHKDTFRVLAYQYGSPDEDADEDELNSFSKIAIADTKRISREMYRMKNYFIASEFSLHQEENWSRCLGIKLMEAGADASWNGG